MQIVCTDKKVQSNKSQINTFIATVPPFLETGFVLEKIVSTTGINNDRRTFDLNEFIVQDLSGKHTD